VRLCAASAAASRRGRLIPSSARRCGTSRRASPLGPREGVELMLREDRGTWRSVQEAEPHAYGRAGHPSQSGSARMPRECAPCRAPRQTLRGIPGSTACRSRQIWQDARRLAPSRAPACRSRSRSGRRRRPPLGLCVFPASAAHAQPRELWNPDRQPARLSGPERPATPTLARSSSASAGGASRRA